MAHVAQFGRRRGMLARRAHDADTHAAAHNDGVGAQPRQRATVGTAYVGTEHRIRELLEAHAERVLSEVELVITDRAGHHVQPVEDGHRRLAGVPVGGRCAREQVSGIDHDTLARRRAFALCLLDRRRQRHGPALRASSFVGAIGQRAVKVTHADHP